MFPPLNTLFITSQLKWLKKRDEAQIRVEIPFVSRNPLKILPFNLMLFVGFRNLSVWVQTSPEEMATWLKFIEKQ